MVLESTIEDRNRPAPYQSWGEKAVSFASQLASDSFQRRDLADLRRMDPDAPNAAAFWRLMARQNLLGSPLAESKWAVILNGIALMTNPVGTNTAYRSAHDKSMPVGKALFLGGDVSRATAFYSEPRINRLLVAHGPMLRALLGRMFRMMAASGQRFNWHQMSQLVLSDGYDDARAESIRRNIARDYYWAESYATRTRS